MFNRGADPELFFRNGRKYTPSLGLVGGSKKDPRYYGNGVHLQEDNVTVEYNIPPCKTLEDWEYYNKEALRHIGDIAKRNGLHVSIRGSAFFSKESLKPEELRVAGCEPDFNIYTMSDQNTPALDSNWRAAGGHLHMSIPMDSTDNVIRTVKLLDILIGIPTTLADSERFRRRFYGKAGSIRVKDYGIEYRTPSNKWVSTEKWRSYVFNAMERAVDWGTDASADHLLERTQQDVRKAIDEYDKEAGLRVLAAYKNLFVNLT